MPRLPRLYRVVGILNATDIERRNYLTPNAAEERAERMREAGREVTVTPSHPVTFPHEAGDTEALGIPDGTIPAGLWAHFATMLGILPERIHSITVDRTQLVVTYAPTPEGRRTERDTPLREWRIEVTP